MIIRMFDTAVDPADVELAKEIFLAQVQPAFEKFEGCHGIDMYIGLEQHSQNLTDVAALSKWDSMALIEKAVAGEEYTDALVNLKRLFQQTPIVRHFETLL
jgi:hypothetical protein